MIRVSILGATGYSGGELLRYLLAHPAVKIQHLTSESSAGKPVSLVHPEFRGRVRAPFEKLNVRKVASNSEVVFSCYPAGVGIRPNAQFLRMGLKVIDLSADFRLPTSAHYRTWYRFSHPKPALLKSAVYGLPELFRQKIILANLIANPGCYATAAILSASPLLTKGWIDPRSLIVDAKSGVTGAGKKVTARYMFSEVENNLQAYAVASHRHQPEMEHVLKLISHHAPEVTFTPQLVPLQRGILSILYATLRKHVPARDIRALYREAYECEPFVRILPDGDLPQTKSVTHTNYCDIGIVYDRRARRVVVLAAIDNLGKGAAGQAVQNMNLCLNRPEKEGLT